MDSLHQPFYLKKRPLGNREKEKEDRETSRAIFLANKEAKEAIRQPVGTGKIDFRSFETKLPSQRDRRTEAKLLGPFRKGGEAVKVAFIERILGIPSSKHRGDNPANRNRKLVTSETPESSIILDTNIIDLDMNTHIDEQDAQIMNDSIVTDLQGDLNNAELLGDDDEGEEEEDNFIDDVTIMQTKTISKESTRKDSRRASSRASLLAGTFDVQNRLKYMSALVKIMCFCAVMNKKLEDMRAMKEMFSDIWLPCISIQRCVRSFQAHGNLRVYSKEWLANNFKASIAECRQRIEARALLAKFLMDTKLSAGVLIKAVKNFAL